MSIQGCCFRQAAAVLLPCANKMQFAFCSSGILPVLGKKLLSASCCVSCHSSIKASGILLADEKLF